MRGSETDLRIFSSTVSPLYFLRQCLALNLELTGWATLTGPQAFGIYLSQLFTCKHQDSPSASTWVLGCVCMCMSISSAASTFPIMKGLKYVALAGLKLAM